MINVVRLVGRERPARLQGAGGIAVSAGEGLGGTSRLEKGPRHLAADSEACGWADREFTVWASYRYLRAIRGPQGGGAFRRTRKYPGLPRS